MIGGIGTMIGGQRHKTSLPPPSDNILTTEADDDFETEDGALLALE